MCKKRSTVRAKVKVSGVMGWKYIRVDACLRNLIEFLNNVCGVETLACCCGHGEYNMSIIVKSEDGLIFDLISNKIINRKKRFYKKDAEGFFFIPEVVNNVK